MDNQTALVGQPFAYFLIPLPEPLGIAAGRIFTSTGVEDYGDFYRRVCSGHNEAAIEAGPQPVSFISVKVHHVMRQSIDGDVSTQLFELAHRLFPWAVPRRPLWHRMRKAAERKAMLFRRSNRPGGLQAHMTVVEFASWIRDETDVESGMSDAFDRGLEYVRELQTAYHLARRHPITMCTRESLPFAVPAAVGRPRLGLPPSPEVELSPFLLNMNLWSHTREPDLSEAEWRTMVAALDVIRSDRPFLTYAECQREAIVALRRHGNYRVAAILAATAAEALLDDLLLHLMWEELSTPEQAAEMFADPRRSLVARVRADYAPRLGGTWDPNRPGPIADWARDVGRLRHRAVHGGYVPTIGEAQASVAGLEKLGEFISERLSDPARLSRYPRTAMALLGEQWLREANLWRGTVRKVAEDNDEPSWSELFARWRATVEQLRLQEAEAEVLSANEAILLLIITPGGEETWVLHDRERRLAAQTEGPSEPSAALETVSRLREALKADPPVHAVSVAMPQGPLGHAPTSEWLPEYHLVPDAAVMLDRSDPGLHWRGTHGRG